jgi:formate dehydrogenase subunit gamma
MAASRVHRFSRTERWLHWVHAGAFGVMLLTGLILFAPPLSRVFSDRPLVKSIHLIGAVAWVIALVLVAIVGDRRGLGRTRRELERFDADDVLFIRRRPSRPARFNGGQKLHAAGQAALLVLFYVSGALLWLGERNTDLRLAGTLPLHDFATFVGVVLLIGHVLKTAQAPGSLEGMTGGTVTTDYAERHHPRWRAGA